MGWKEGEMDLVWDRSVSKADGNQLTLDAPLTMALDNNGELSKCYVIVGRAESQKQVWRI